MPALNKARSVRLTPEAMRELIAAARYARDYNEELTEDQCSILDMARQPLIEALGIINYERTRNGERLI